VNTFSACTIDASRSAPMSQLAVARPKTPLADSKSRMYAADSASRKPREAGSVMSTRAPAWSAVRAPVSPARGGASSPATNGAKRSCSPPSSLSSLTRPLRFAVAASGRVAASVEE
jgi:hypothetical protein